MIDPDREQTAETLDDAAEAVREGGVLGGAGLGALVGGLLWALHTAQKVGLERGITSIPVAVFSTAATAVMLGLLL